VYIDNRLSSDFYKVQISTNSRNIILKFVAFSIALAKPGVYSNVLSEISEDSYSKYSVYR
jgi:hypothetical protein